MKTNKNIIYKENNQKIELKKARTVSVHPWYHSKTAALNICIKKYEFTMW